MKDIIISGSTYNGVEQIFFKKAGGGTARFVDADVKSRGETACTLTSHTLGDAYYVDGISVADATPAATMTLEE